MYFKLECVGSILKSSNTTFDKFETKENLKKLCIIQSLHFRRQFLSLVTLFRCIHSHPNYLAMFHITVTKSERCPNKLVFHSHGRILSSMFLFQAGTLWNCLPPTITSIINIAGFKRELHNSLAKFQFNCQGMH